MKRLYSILLVSVFVMCGNPLWGQTVIDLSDVGEVVLENNGAAEAQQPIFCTDWHSCIILSIALQPKIFGRPRLLIPILPWHTGGRR